MVVVLLLLPLLLLLVTMPTIKTAHNKRQNSRLDSPDMTATILPVQPAMILFANDIFTGHGASFPAKAPRVPCSKSESTACRITGTACVACHLAELSKLVAAPPPQLALAGERERVRFASDDLGGNS